MDKLYFYRVTATNGTYSQIYATTNKERARELWEKNVPSQPLGMVVKIGTADRKLVGDEWFVGERLVDMR